MTVWQKCHLQRLRVDSDMIQITVALNVNSKAAEWQTRNLHFYMLLVALLLTSPIPMSSIKAK